MSKFPKLKNKTVLAPMSGVTDVAFRALCKRYGAALTCTEFVSSAALTRSNKKTFKMLVTDKTEKPVAVQLFGGSIDEIVDAAQMIENMFDIIDINCGCPAWKVVKSGAGSAMLRNPAEIEKFVSLLVSKLKKPVSVKIRTGIDDKKINAVTVAQCIESAGAAAITVHGRTQEQGFSGVADWNIIREVKQAVNIPVIGNGDVSTPERFAQCIAQSGVDAVMIGRAAMHNPYIFKQITDYLKNGSYDEKNSIEQFFEYLKIAEKYEISFLDIKGHAMRFAKNMKNASQLRERISLCVDMDEINEAVENYKDN